MKSFLEEYGFSILAAIVVILLIMMMSPVGTAIKDSLATVVTKFTNTSEDGMQTANDRLPYLYDTAAATKGDIVELEHFKGHKFRILEDDGETITLMAMQEEGKTYFRTENIRENFGVHTGPKYADSELDRAMEDWVDNTLPEFYRERIVPRTIYQNAYLSGWYEDTDYYGKPLFYMLLSVEETGSAGRVDKLWGIYSAHNHPVLIGERRAYALSIEEAYKYFGKDTISDPEIKEFSFGKSGPNDYNTFMRDISLPGRNEDPDSQFVYALYRVRPDASRVFASIRSNGEFGLRPVFTIKTNGVYMRFAND